MVFYIDILQICGVLNLNSGNMEIIIFCNSFNNEEQLYNINAKKFSKNMRRL